MRDVLDELVGWWQAGQTVGMGTVVATWRSAPRPAGASMLVGPDGTAVVEIDGDPARQDLDHTLARRAADAGCLSASDLRTGGALG